MPDLAPVMCRQYPDPDGEVDRWVRRFLRTGRPHRHRHAADDAHLRLQGELRLRAPLRARHAAAALTLKLGRGSCRDLALLMIEALRCLGLAARFVSGYLYVPSRDRDGARYRGGGSTHAWCQVYLPGAGWVEFDPTNAIVGNRDLIRVAVARDPSQAIPLSGSYSARPTISRR